MPRFQVSDAQVLGPRFYFPGYKCQVSGPWCPGIQVPGFSIRKNKLWIDFYTYAKSLNLQLRLESLHFAGVLFKTCSENMSQTPMRQCYLNNCITSAWVILLHFSPVKTFKNLEKATSFQKHFGHHG